MFTPNGDLYKLPQGASLLDFAFNIHTKVGSQCVGGRVNGKNRKLNYRLTSGDTVEIFTSSQQEPSHDWLNIVVTSKARNKIRALLKEAEAKSADIGKEMLLRRLKNHKIEFDEATMSRTLTRMGHKNSIEFFSALGHGDIDITSVIDAYTGSGEKPQEAERVSASEFTLQNFSAPDSATAAAEGKDGSGQDVLVIGEGIKVHRSQCKNAIELMHRYPYRIVNTQSVSYTHLRAHET